MVWSRKGDNAATHPKALAVKALAVREGDPRLFNEVRGFIDGCYSESAGHKTDYLVTEGMAIDQGGVERWEELVRVAVKVGLMTKVPRRREWMLFDDPAYVHLRLKADVDWEAQRKRDLRDDRLIGPVRLRDGDECRYCPRIVTWGPGHRVGNIYGTYDHFPPRQAATVDTLFVVCGKCNTQRNGRVGQPAPPDNVRDQLPPLKPAPVRPYYSRESAEFLTRLGYHVTPTGDGTVQQEQQPAPSAQTRATRAQEQQAAPSARPRPATAAGAATGAQRETSATPDGLTASAGPADPCPPCRDGPGRDGSGAASPSPPPAARASPSPTDAIPLPSPGRARPPRRRGARGRGARRTTEET
ncbi:hypothetical protein WDZ16_13025 [Pseudokineococcus marinus]|uniref:HNH endonuclease n=1 Tax=Pseudokineococcus marinus TaxID=351215 RepID=A0A849BVS2_9ACTN|nr:hypothetical protein [Pseudokineococcus marinus]NNH21658.1 hypothetical protein [Pseudokineococcus marinus]